MNRLVLDGEKILNREILHDILAQGLHFPEHYGRNLDALFDCLTDVQEDTEILLWHRDALGANLKRYAASLVEVLYEASQENPCIRFGTLDHKDME